MLRRVDYGETSHVLSLFGALGGKVSVIAKGARRPKTKFVGPLDVATLHEVVYFPRERGLSVLAESHLVDRFAPLHAHLRTNGTMHCSATSSSSSMPSCAASNCTSRSSPP